MKLKLVVSLTASIGAVVLSSAAAHGQTPTEDSVRGAGALASGLRIEVDARSGPSGENPRGTFVAAFGRGSDQYSVVCLQVTGNTAVLGVNRVDAAVGALIRITDGSPDTFGGMPSFVPVDEQDCRTPFVGSPPLPLVSGDLVVTDAQPFPSSKNECKHGGWQRFGFENQGQCVAFVQRGPGR